MPTEIVHKKAPDVRGALRFRSSWPPGPFHSDKVATALAQYLLSHGCNPDLVSSDGFSWRAMSRLLDILDRHAPL